ncbi:hypothetical protein A2U01_0072519, partial [Trifolium medium]|nr:hypothetical protein [Trifolium medium]
MCGSDDDDDGLGLAVSLGDLEGGVLIRGGCDIMGWASRLKRCFRVVTVVLR